MSSLFAYILFIYSLVTYCALTSEMNKRIVHFLRLIEFVVAFMDRCISNTHSYLLFELALMEEEMVN